MTVTNRRGARDSTVLAGKYRLDGLLGAGGMGEVYRAKRISDDAPFAVKILREEHSGDPILVERFLREARAADLVRHPNVVRVLDTGMDDAGTPFFVQELFVGEDLALCLKSCGGRLTHQIAIDLLLPIIEAMAVAHDHGVVHRDLKPGNVFLARIGGDTTPKLLDFGISSLAASTEISRITSTGISLGTPAYMSPEQVMGQTDVDARSDVWSLGVMLYELIAGTLPFVRGETPGALFVQICTNNPIPLESVTPEIPRSLARVVGRCLRRSRMERFANAAELADALRAVREGTAVNIPSLPAQDGGLANAAAASRAARSLGDGSSEDMATVGAPSGATRGALFSTASHGSVHELELEESPLEEESALKLASVIPPPTDAWRAGSVARPVIRRDEPPAPKSSLGFLAIAATLAVGGTIASPWREGWSIFGALVDVPRAATIAIAATSLAAGGFVAVRGVRRAQIAIGLLAAAIGFVGLAIALGVDALLPGQLAELPPRVVPWAAALVPVGVGTHGSAEAKRLWSSGQRLLAVALVLASACAFVIAAHLARAAFR